MPRTRRSPDERRLTLLTVGRQLLGQRSFAEFSLEEAATLAGVSRPLVYRYFLNKRTFYLEVAKQGVAELEQQLESSEDVPIDRLRVGLDRCLAWVEDNSASYARFMAAADSDPQLHALRRRFHNRIIRNVCAAIGVQKAGPFLDLALRGWIGCLEQMTLAWIRKPKMDRASRMVLLVNALMSILETVAFLDPSSGIKVFWR